MTGSAFNVIFHLFGAYLSVDKYVQTIADNIFFLGLFSIASLTLFVVTFPSELKMQM